MFRTYKNYKKYFESLLSSKDVPEEDKKRIRDLLNKRWNPYVLSHSAITEKSGMLSSDSKLRQYAGWTPRSNMHYKYVHFGGGESMNDLLKTKGILKDDKHSVNILAPKICPHCKEQNRPDAQFCYKCNFVISFEAHQKSMEERERKDQEIRELKEQVGEIRWLYEDLIKRNITVRNFTKDGVEIFDGFGNRISSRPLTKEERKKIDEPTND
jgi:glutaredoxin